MKKYGLQKVTLLDYPGKVAATVFTYSCNFRCHFCHNPELVVEQCPDWLFNGSEIMDYLKSRIGLIDGVVFTGGEPLLHRDIEKLIDDVRSLGYKIKMDTNGAFPEVINRLNKKGLVDYWAMDIKTALTSASYNAIGADGSSVEKIKKSISLLMKSGVDYEFRTTVVPAFHNTEVIEAIGKSLSGAKLFSVQAFRPGKVISSEKSGYDVFHPKELEQFKKILEKYVERVVVKA